MSAIFANAYEYTSSSNLLWAELASKLTKKEKLQTFLRCLSGTVPRTFDTTCLGTLYPTAHIFRYSECKINEKKILLEQCSIYILTVISSTKVIDK